MNYALDIILLCVFLLFTAVGVKRGFIRSAAHFLGSVVAAFLASALGGAAAQWVFDALFRGALVEKIETSIASLGGGDAGAAVRQLLGTLPDFLVRALESAGVTAAALEGTLAAKTGEAAELIADSLAPVFVGFLKVLAVIVLFLLFLMLARMLADLLGTAFRLPVLRQLDGALGGLFGFLLALITLWVLVSAVGVFFPMLEPQARLSIQNALRNSLLAGALVRLNPLGAMFR